MGPLIRESWNIILLGLPIVFVGLTFLHAARVPQWTWAMAGRAQIIWVASLLVGAAIIPLGIPLATFYLVKVRPELVDVERGDLSRLTGEPPDNSQ